MQERDLMEPLPKEEVDLEYEKVKKQIEGLDYDHAVRALHASAFKYVPELHEIK